ncbi:winged helix-turn-helix domain-containing protein [Nocardia vaccinii]|uniref:winged helix-turn-helix domain-containing protein n=1 Tax=Nocardia vaccinii TaxID=1822 RepID=UPI00083247D8|nr:winged helix-turn-helix domain-containing protein [Nocardia vaccinii]
MSTRAVPSARTGGRGLLISVAGVGPGSGVTTTTVAVARAWPGPDRAVIVEADSAGGQLADAVGADPYRGLASLARTAQTGAQATSLELTEHLQRLPGGVGFLASPPGPDAGPRGVWTAALLARTEREQRAANLPEWRNSDLTVFADCGAPEARSVTAAILRGADARLIVVHTDRDDPAHARRRILELADHRGHRGIVLIGADPDGAFRAALALPVLTCLPEDPHSASALLRTPRWPRRNRLLRAARTATTVIHTDLRPSPPVATDTDTRHERAQTPPRNRIPAHRASGPTVYRIDLPVRSHPGLDPAARSIPGPTLDPMPQDDPDPVHAEGGHRAQTATAAPHAQHSTASRTPAGPAEPDTTTAPTAAPESDSPPSRTEETATGPGTTSHAREPAATTPTPGAPEPPAAMPPTPAPCAPGPVLSVQVFGPLRVLWLSAGGAAPVEITHALRPRERELLILLAVRPGGVTREAVIAALWPEHRSRRPTNTLNTLMSRLRKALTTAVDEPDVEFIAAGTVRFRLAPGVWDVDYVRFDAAVAALRAATDAVDRERACRAILGAAEGVLAEELGADWIAPIREQARRDRLKALGKLAAMLVETDPDQTLALLETALLLDPTNEPIYQDILRLHARLGEHTVINPTLALLKQCLESIGDIPTQHTLDIATLLRNQNPGKNNTNPGPS